MSSPSVLRPVGMALETVRRVLFQPFQFVKWLAIGFTAWLAMLDDGLGFGFNFHPGQFNKEQASQCAHVARDWFLAHLFLVIPLVIVAVTAGLAVWLVVTWLGCRGKFMFLDNVVGNRAEIIQPWRKFRAPGNSCFLFSICFDLAAAAVLLLGVGLALLVSWPDLARTHFGWHAAGAIGFGVVFMFCFIMTAAVIRVFFEDFVIPVMAMRTCRVMEGWKTFFDLFKHHAGIFILYLLFKAVILMAVGFITVFLCCLLCCTVLIPYVGVVILLPVYVFLRSYSVHFLGQFGKTLKMFENNGASYIVLS
ncbi:MAG: hypothetical protein PHP98_07130 [Kiritimatiellae bacterium]|nr:hypothetical protein [Kiritimatiellia bacterium]